MKLSARCEVFATFNYGDGVWKKMKELGCEYIDYPLGGGEPEEKLLAVKKLVYDAGLRVEQIHGPWAGVDDDESTPEIRARKIEGMKRSIRKASEILECPNWVIHPMFPYGNSSKNPEEVWDINVEFLTALLPCAKEYGVTICLENQQYKEFPFSTPEKTLELIRHINDDNLKLCLDVGHSIYQGIQPADAVRMAGSDLRALHVHDNDKSDDHHGLPYTGHINWNEFMKALREINYSGTISFEGNYLNGDGTPFLEGAPDEVRFQCLKAIFNCLLNEK